VAIELTVNAATNGSIWNRWDPHIHTPDTLLNNQYGSSDAWESFITKIETSQPLIRALGITDYLSLDQYEVVRGYKNSGRLPNVNLIFPNIEMRFGLETSKGSGVNVHLLFSPDDHDHVEQIRRFLERLEFQYLQESYRCRRDELIRLGRKHQPETVTDQAALQVGVNQFKVTFDQLRDEWGKSEWVRQNCFVAVAVGEHDGTSGLRDSTHSFNALRKSIEAFAHIIFSSSTSQRDFWLGRKSATIDDLESKWGGLKPCLHGSDAHDLAHVSEPDGNRFCWIKGDLTFESVRQSCIEPEGRVHVGSVPPRGSLATRTIKEVRVSNVPWMNPVNMALNPGLVAIIGARGSGKTALAELIAAGGLAIHAQLNPKSFIVRAREHLENSRSELEWEDGDVTGHDFRQKRFDDYSASPRVQYLSQQFVDELCSADGLADSLVEEIERVIFNAHPVADREGAGSFEELYSLRSTPAIDRRTSHEQDFQDVCDQLTQERQQKHDLPAFTAKRVEIVKQIEQDQKDRSALIGKGQELRTKRHEEIVEALGQRRRLLEASQTQLRSLKALKADVADARLRLIPSWHTGLQVRRSEALLAPSEWKAFEIGFIGDVDSILDNRIVEITAECKRIVGVTTIPNSGSHDPTVPLIAKNAVLSDQTVATLEAELARVQQLIGIDKDNLKRFATLNDKITKSNRELARLDTLITSAKSADGRIEALTKRRGEAYAGVFQAIVDLEQELRLLYSPLSRHLSGESGPLGRLGFEVRRHVNIKQWAEMGEKLLDLRRSGPFKGQGSLFDAARDKLLIPWQSGTPEQVSAAMFEFIQANELAIRTHKPESENNRKWSSAIAKWLHSTAHIEVAYGVQYDGIEIERLSPGTRGIVLLLLYLAIDDEDDRPLIIDQPEENLDPQSVFDELVSRFRIAKKRRQIIIVTHNANLVVNTDADQVIVATASEHLPGKLPLITYESGGLENPLIRKRVCDILEGGERAFKARARRLRVGLHEQFARQVAIVSS